MVISLVKVEPSEKKIALERGHLTMNENVSGNRRGSVEGVIQRCGLCSLISSLLRRAMCVGSRRGSGESYYQELANTAVSLKRCGSFSLWVLFAFNLPPRPGAGTENLLELREFCNQAQLSTYKLQAWTTRKQPNCSFWKRQRSKWVRVVAEYLSRISSRCIHL